MWAWLKGLLGAAEVVMYAFQCVVCGLRAVLSLQDASVQGWTFKDGWRCDQCSKI